MGAKVTLEAFGEAIAEYQKAAAGLQQCIQEINNALTIAHDGLNGRSEYDKVQEKVQRLIRITQSEIDEIGALESILKMDEDYYYATLLTGR